MAILHGVVPSYHLKQLAQEILRKLDGVDLVINRIAVQWSGSE
jgi:osmotically-inducible protein OsmY